MVDEISDGASDLLEVFPYADKGLVKHGLMYELRRLLCVLDFVEDTWCSLLIPIFDADGQQPHVFTS